VGRQRELALLHDRAAMMRVGAGQVLTLLGPPGIGKSRLLLEFQRQLPPAQVTWYAGQCLTYGQMTPYLPVRDMVQQVCGLAAADPLAVRTAAVRRRLTRLGQVTEEDVALLLQVLALPVAPEALGRLSPEVWQARTFTLLWHLLRQEAQQRPLVLVVAAVLGTAHLPATQRQQLVVHGAGNPFFLEELAWHAVAYGCSLTSVPLPETVHAVVAARLARLPAPEKALLQTAAAVGLEVPMPLLQALTELPEAALQRGLAHLQAAEFLSETRLFPEPVYAFKHALIQEVVYNSLLRERRRALHARLVAAVERLSADGLPEQAERLAQHAVRGEVWDKAVAYCRQAGAKALARGAFREVVACYEQALAALRYLPESRAMQEQAIDLRLDLRGVLLELGDLQPILAHLSAAATLAEALGDQPRRGRVAAFMCRYLREMGDYDSAVAAGQQALAVAETLGDGALRIMAQQFLGVAYYARGDHRRALGVLRRNVEALAEDQRQESFGLVGYPAVNSRAWLVRCLAELGAFPEGSAQGAAAVRIAEAVEHPTSLLHAYLGVGFLALRTGDFATAIPVLERCLELCRVYNILLWFPETAAALGYAYAWTGRVSEAFPLLEQAEQRGLRW
jgi:tetratricopeptide (TPR) repeat protein